MVESKIPGNLVFGRRRFLKALAPADGTLGVPQVLCVTSNTFVEIVLIPSKVVVAPI